MPFGVIPCRNRHVAGSKPGARQCRPCRGPSRVPPPPSGAPGLPPSHSLQGGWPTVSMPRPPGSHEPAATPKLQPRAGPARGASRCPHPPTTLTSVNPAVKSSTPPGRSSSTMGGRGGSNFPALHPHPRRLEGLKQLLLLLSGSEVMDTPEKANEKGAFQLGEGPRHELGGKAKGALTTLEVGWTAPKTECADRIVCEKKPVME